MKRKCVRGSIDTPIEESVKCMLNIYKIEVNRIQQKMGEKTQSGGTGKMVICLSNHLKYQLKP